MLETAAADFAWSTAAETAAAVAAGRPGALKIVEAALARVRARDPLINAFTAVIDGRALTFDGVELPVRPHLGVYTQPISFIGLPVVVVPVPTSPLPIGVQVIAAPWREDVALRIVHALEAQGVVAAPRPPE